MNELNFEPIDYPLIIQKDKTQTTLIEDKHLKVKEIVNAHNKNIINNGAVKNYE